MRSILVLVLVTAAATTHAQAPKTDAEKAAYTLGVQAARGLSALGLTGKDAEMARNGFADALAGKPKVDPAQYGQKAQELAQAKLAEQAKKHEALGKAYSDKAAAEPGAQKTASGLVYILLKEGTGDVPRPTDTAKFNYEGRLVDGTVFDASPKKGPPAEAAIAEIIPCWAEGLQKMRVGGKAKFVCPSAIAYGAAGRPPVIPGGSTLSFDVELVGVSATPAKPAGPRGGGMPSGHPPTPKP